MFLVDKLGIFVLVGLICTLGIGPARGDEAVLCKGVTAACADAAEFCAIDMKTGMEADACKTAADCQDSPMDGIAKCDTGKPYCCCTSGKGPCNAANEAALKEVCMNNTAPAACQTMPVEGGPSTMKPVGPSGPPETPNPDDLATSEGTSGAGSSLASIGQTIVLVSAGAYLHRDASRA